jgi:hypothetical protein
MSRAQLARIDRDVAALAQAEAERRAQAWAGSVD